MTMTNVWALAASGLLLAGFAGNEVSHGGWSEAMGLGHHHVTDSGGYHCAGPDNAEHWDHHVEHMHGGNATAYEDHCGADHMGHGGHMRYGGQMGPGMMGGS